MEKEKKQKDVVFAIFLIFIGTIFLLNTTGFVGWGIWEHILRFWPVFLILAGIKLIFDKSPLAEIIIGITALLLFSLITLFSYISYTATTLPFIPERISEHVRNNPEWFLGRSGEEIYSEEAIGLSDFDEIERRDVNINVGASSFTLRDREESKEYIHLESRHYEGYIEPSLNSKLNGDTLEILFKTISPRRISFWGNTFSPEFNLILGQTEIKTDLDIQLGAGKGVVKLESTNLGEINCKSGAGKLELSLENNAIPERINIDLGAGQMTLNIPEDVGYELTYELGVGRISTNGESIADFIGEDPSFKSVNYNEASNIVQITAKVGVGALVINHK
jgi:hypothetical protein